MSTEEHVIIGIIFAIILFLIIRRDYRKSVRLHETVQDMIANGRSNKEILRYISNETDHDGHVLVSFSERYNLIESQIND